MSTGVVNTIVTPGSNPSGSASSQDILYATYNKITQLEVTSNENLRRTSAILAMLPRIEDNAVYRLQTREISDQQKIIDRILRNEMEQADASHVTKDQLTKWLNKVNENQCATDENVEATRQKVKQLREEMSHLINFNLAGVLSAIEDKVKGFEPAMRYAINDAVRRVQIEVHSLREDLRTAGANNETALIRIGQAGMDRFPEDQLTDVVTRAIHNLLDPVQTAIDNVFEESVKWRIHHEASMDRWDGVGGEELIMQKLEDYGRSINQLSADSQFKNASISERLLVLEEKANTNATTSGNILAAIFSVNRMQLAYQNQRGEQLQQSEALITASTELERKVGALSTLLEQFTLPADILNGGGKEVDNGVHDAKVSDTLKQRSLRVFCWAVYKLLELTIVAFLLASLLATVFNMAPEHTAGPESATTKA